MEEILAKLKEQDEKINKIYRSVEKTRKYFLWTLVIGVVTFILPLIAIIIIIPWFIKTLTSAYGI